jgi:hypothetical protein
MRVPGFTAEAGLHRTSANYRMQHLGLTGPANTLTVLAQRDCWFGETCCQWEQQCVDVPYACGVYSDGTVMMCCCDQLCGPEECTRCCNAGGPGWA